MLLVQKQGDLATSGEKKKIVSYKVKQNYDVIVVV